MAATNLPDILDPALTRPGRFDRHVSYLYYLLITLFYFSDFISFYKHQFITLSFILGNGLEIASADESLLLCWHYSKIT